MAVMGKKALVTGAGGFIGSHLCAALAAEGVRVRAMVRYNSRNDWGQLEHLGADVLSSLEVLSGDIRDPFFVASAVEGCDVVFHLAALIAIPYSYSAPQTYVETNITGTLNVLEAARRHGTARVIHTSTSETYGTALYVPIDEAHPLQGQSPYSASKIGADKLAESYFRSFGLPVVTVRPFNTFGPRQSPRAVIPNIIIQALAGEPIRLGSLDPVRDLTYVADTVAGFVAAASRDGVVGETINLGTGEGISIGDLVPIVLDAVGADLPVELDAERVRPNASEVFRLISDNRKAADLLKWSPRFSVREGIEAMVPWYRENLGRYKPSLYNV